jgi:hypothetical protein
MRALDRDVVGEATTRPCVMLRTSIEQAVPGVPKADRPVARAMGRALPPLGKRLARPSNHSVTRGRIQ